MAQPSDSSPKEIVDGLSRLASAIADQVNALARGSSANRQALEKAVLDGLAAAGAIVQDLEMALESARLARQGAGELVEALYQAEQKLAFFQGCTMRRSASALAKQGDLEGWAGQAERLAQAADPAAGLERLVEAYKATEAIEARIVQARGAGKTSAAPEPRILDLPRARVLAARRAIGAALLSLDEED